MKNVLRLLVLSVAFSNTLPMFAQDTPAEKSQAAAPEPTSLFEPRQFAGKAASGEAAVLQYRLLKPLAYDPTATYPLVIFLHGAGERGDDNAAQLKHGMKEFCSPKRREDLPCYVLAPQCPDDQQWTEVDWTLPTMLQPKEASNSLKLVLALVDEMIGNAAIDTKRIYITGLSMGGYGTWDAIARRPNFFAAAVPICGGADTTTASKISHMPIWCFHGAKDNVVTVDLSRKMMDALKQDGGTPKYTEYPEAKHDSWTTTYENADMHKWMFAQRLKPPAQAKAQSAESK